MPLKISRRGAIPSFIVMDVMRAAGNLERAGKAVVHMEIGQPSTPAPSAVREAAKAALDQELLGYTEAFGISPLRQRISRHYADFYGEAVDPENVVVTAGSSGAFVLSFLAAFDVGDRVALASPGYPAYRNILTALGVEVVSLPVGPETNFQPTAACLAKLEGPLHGLIIASPSNPAGTMIDSKELSGLVTVCADRGIRVISDEVYHGITYGKPNETTLAFSRDAIIVNSFSKYFSMTGWRLGWMVVPEDLLRPVECLAQNLFISPPTLAQVAGMAAFDCCDELDGHVSRYARNRALLLEGLPAAGFDRLASADGAFYIYADIGAMSNDSEAFCRQMLNEIGIAATPGTDFDPDRGHRYVRFSFAGSTEEMTMAVRLLKKWRIRQSG